MTYNTIYTTKKFIEISSSIHKGKYDYTKSNYIQCDKKVVIVCRDHGEFKQAPTRHMKGAGCPECAKLIPIELGKKLAKEAGKRIINEIINKYKNLSVCDETKYENIKEPIVLRCKDHGLIKKTPNIFRSYGCSVCASYKKKTKRLINRLEQKFGDKYDLSRVKIIKDAKTVVIGCPNHGWVKSNIKSISRKDRDQCCPKCGRESSHLNHKLTHDDFMIKAKKVHGNKYDYTFVDYASRDDKLMIRCKSHGFFFQTAANHLEGRQGCSKCLNELFESWAVRPKMEREMRKGYRSGKNKKRAEKYGVKYEPVNKLKVFKRDKYKCKVCGIKTKLGNPMADNASELGHIVPISKGGSHTYSNVQCECRKCNGLKGDKIDGQQLTIFSRVEV